MSNSTDHLNVTNYLEQQKKLRLQVKIEERKNKLLYKLKEQKEALGVIPINYLRIVCPKYKELIFKKGHSHLPDTAKVL